MIALAVDENFDRHILRAVLRRLPQLDVADVVTAGLGGADDTEVLAWAASEGRVVLTHDVRTMTRFAYDRVREGLPMPGVIEVRSQAAVGDVLDELLLIITCATAADRGRNSGRCVSGGGGRSRWSVNAVVPSLPHPHTVK